MATQAQSVLNTKSEIVNRKLDKPAYKAAISPGLPPSQPPSGKPGNLATSQPNYPSCLPSNRIPPKGPPQFCILHFDLCIFRYKCRESSTNRPLFVQTNPISKTAKISANPVPTKDYGNEGPSARPKNEPKRTQTNPKRTQFFTRQGPSKPKRTQTNPKQTQPVAAQRLAKSDQPKNRPNFFHRKGLRQKCQILPQKNKPKQTQSKANRTPSGAEIPTGELHEILNPGTDQTQFVAGAYVSGDGT